MAEAGQETQKTGTDPNDPLGLDNYDMKAVQAVIKANPDHPLARHYRQGLGPSLQNYESWRNEPYARDLLKLCAAAIPDYVFDHKKVYASQPDAVEWFKFAARKEADDIAQNFHKYSDLPYAREITNEMARVAPLEALTAAELMTRIRVDANAGSYLLAYPYQFMNDSNGFVATALKQNLVAKALEEPLAILFVSELLKGHPNEKTIMEIVKDKDRLLEAAKKDDVAAFMAYRNYRELPFADEVLQVAYDASDAEELNQILVWEINNRHEEPPETRFASVDNSFMDAQKLYDLIVEGAEELYTSSYQGLLNRMLSRMDENGDKMIDILENGYDYEAITFFQTAVAYGRFHDVFDRLEAKDQSFYIEKMLEDAAANERKALFDAATLSEIAAHISNPETMKDFEKKLIEKFESAPNDIVRDRMGLLAMSYLKHHEGHLSYPLFFEGIKNDPRYQLRQLERIEPAALFDEHGRNIQVMTFYAHNANGVPERDGQDSYNNFIRTYKRNPENWKIEESESYVHISSRNGREIHIYANKPEYDGYDPAKDGISSIRGAMRTLSPPVKDEGDEKITLIHRGHSYHLDKTLRYLDHNTPFVFLGSCGGSSSQSDVLSKSPKAHIIATSDTGTMFVNDPLLFHINDKVLRAGKPIVWDDTWKFVDSLKDIRKEKYINPSNNNSVIFISSFYGLHPDSVAPAAAPTPAAPAGSPATPEPAPVTEPPAATHLRLNTRPFS